MNHQILNAYAAFGADHFIHKVGGKWACPAINPVKVCRTKKEARQLVEAYMDGLLR